ncbi:MAG: hypothetical protein JWR73_1528 [Tardiphaga sp.]|jgi:hypothetical protein|nr:hypothetical protein [Tardiphaga sp.]MDB5572949.1 hypothetical protein [Tardiphaga sp.]MDB5625726.1 hypothetical protein [Tardiphaga sp.]MDB5631001.1 hypothetical protein [Tardiphaga sp.]
MLGVAGTLGGCASVVADLPVIGLPADAPARPKEQRAFLPVHDLPASRSNAALTTTEQSRLQSELLDARARSAAAAAAK